MTFFTLVLIAVIILAVIGLGWNTFVVAVLDGFDRTLDVGIPIIKNLTQEAAATTEPLMGPFGPVGPDAKLKAIDDCMISLEAQNPRQAHLLECDEMMPLVPLWITNEFIYNSTDVTEKLNKYLNQRALEPITEEDLR